MEVIDHKILRTIVGAHAKTPTEMLYLETGELDIPSVMSVRRLMYWYNIVKRHKGELISQVYNAMKANPIKGDWIHLVVDDLNKMDMSLDNEKHVLKMTKSEFKDIVKDKITEYSLREQEKRKRLHSKVKDVKHEELTKPEKYLTNNNITYKLSSLIFNLRCKGQTEFKANFHNMQESNVCPLCKEDNDTQEHALTCRIVSKDLRNKLMNIEYDDLFGSEENQVKVAKAYQAKIKLRTSLLDPGGTRDTPTGATIPDPATSTALQCLVQRK